MIGGLERVKLSGTHEIAVLTPSWPIRERFYYKNWQGKQLRVKNYVPKFAFRIAKYDLFTLKLDGFLDC